MPTENYDSVKTEIRALIAAEVKDADFRITVTNQGRYSWEVTGVRVEGTVANQRGRNPFFLAKTLEQARTKLPVLLQKLAAMREEAKRANASQLAAQHARTSEMETMFAKLAAAGYAPQMPPSAYPSITVRLSVGCVTISNWKHSGLQVAFEIDNAMHNATGALALLHLLSGPGARK